MLIFTVPELKGRHVTFFNDVAKRGGILGLKQDTAVGVLIMVQELTEQRDVEDVTTLANLLGLERRSWERPLPTPSDN